MGPQTEAGFVIRPTRAEDSADLARRAIVLDEIRHLVGRQDYVRVNAMSEWDKRIGLGARAVALGQPALGGGAPLPTATREVDLFLGKRTLSAGEPVGARDHLLADHGAALRRAHALWQTPAFLSDVIAVLRDDAKLPERVAAAIAPGLLCSYVEWAATGSGSLSPCAYFSPCPLRPKDVVASAKPRGLQKAQAATAARRRRRGPKDAKGGHAYLRRWAQWYFEVVIEGRRQAFVSASPGRPPKEDDPTIAAFIDWSKARGDDEFFTVSAVARRVHKASPHRSRPFSSAAASTCTICTTTVRRGIGNIQKILGLI